MCPWVRKLNLSNPAPTTYGSSKTKVSERTHHDLSAGSPASWRDGKTSPEEKNKNKAASGFMS